LWIEVSFLSALSFQMKSGQVGASPGVNDFLEKATNETA
jgi:hypothetical protein